MQKVEEKVEKLLSIVLRVLDKLGSLGAKLLEELDRSNTGIVEGAIFSSAHWLPVHSIEEVAQLVVDWPQRLLRLVANERRSGFRVVEHLKNAVGVAGVSEIAYAAVVVDVVPI